MFKKLLNLSEKEKSIYDGMMTNFRNVKNASEDEKNILWKMAKAYSGLEEKDKEEYLDIREKIKNNGINILSSENFSAFASKCFDENNHSKAIYDLEMILIDLYIIANLSRKRISKFFNENLAEFKHSEILRQYDTMDINEEGFDDLEQRVILLYSIFSDGEKNNQASKEVAESIGEKIWVKNIDLYNQLNEKSFYVFEAVNYTNHEVNRKENIKIDTGFSNKKASGKKSYDAPDFLYELSKKNIGVDKDFFKKNEKKMIILLQIFMKKEDFYSGQLVDTIYYIFLKHLFGIRQDFIKKCKEVFIAAQDDEIKSIFNDYILHELREYRYTSENRLATYLSKKNNDFDFAKYYGVTKKKILSSSEFSYYGKYLKRRNKIEREYKADGKIDYKKLSDIVWICEKYDESDKLDSYKIKLIYGKVSGKVTISRNTSESDDEDEWEDELDILSKAQVIEEYKSPLDRLCEIEDENLSFEDTLSEVEKEVYEKWIRFEENFEENREAIYSEDLDKDRKYDREFLRRLREGDILNERLEKLERMGIHRNRLFEIRSSISYKKYLFNKGKYKKDRQDVIALSKSIVPKSSKSTLTFWTVEALNRVDKQIFANVENLKEVDIAYLYSTKQEDKIEELKQAISYNLNNDVKFSDYIKAMIRHFIDDNNKPSEEMSDKEYWQIISRDYDGEPIVLNNRNQRNRKPYIFSSNENRNTYRGNEMSIFDNYATNPRERRRKAIFAISLMRNIQVEYVSDIFMKANRDQDFDPKNPYEVLIYFCLKHNKGWKGFRAFLDGRNTLGRKFNGAMRARNTNIHLALPTTEAYKKMHTLDKEEDVFKYISELPFVSSDTYTKKYKELLRTILFKYEIEIANIDFDKKSEMLESDYEEFISREDVSDEDLSKVIEYLTFLNFEYDQNELKRLIGVNSLSHKMSTVDDIELSVEGLKEYLTGEKRAPRSLFIVLFFASYQHFYKDNWDTSKKVKNFISKLNELLEILNFQVLYPPSSVDSLILLCLLNDYPLDAMRSMLRRIL